MAVGILEIETVPAVVMIDLTRLILRRIRPVREGPFAHPIKYPIELLLRRSLAKQNNSAS